MKSLLQSFRDIISQGLNLIIVSNRTIYQPSHQRPLDALSPPQINVFDILNAFSTPRSLVGGEITVSADYCPNYIKQP